MDISEIICVNSTDRHCGVGSYAMMLEELLGKGKLITLVFSKNVRNYEYPGKVFHGFYPPISTGWTLNTTFYRLIYRIRGFHMPQFVHLVDLMTLYPSSRQKGIVTIHDVNYFRRANYSAKYTDKMLRRFMSWDYVLADSYVTKDDLLERGFAEDQIKVIHLGTKEDKWFRMDANELNAQRDRAYPALISISKPIVLTIGDAPHKNVELTHESVKDAYFHIHVGKNPNAHITLDKIDDDALRLVFNMASVFVRINSLEGFGLPPIESLMCGTPSVVSDIPIFHETLGEAGVYAQPNKQSILDAVNHAAANQEQIGKIFDSKYRKHLSIQRFNQEMVRYYESVS